MTDVTITTPSHVFDETGVLPENFISNEQRDLESTPKRAVIPRYGAFFLSSFVMRDANGVEVTKDKYQYALYSDVLSAKIGQDVIGGVVITDSTVQSPVYIDYHCVGGPWGVSNEQIIDLFTKLQVDSRPASWPNILGKPDGYKPAHHLQDIGDLFGAEYFVAALDRLTQAYLMGDAASHDEIWRQIDSVRALIGTSQADLLTTLKQYVDDSIAPFQTQITSVDSRLTNVRTELLAADASIGQRITSVQGTLQTNINSVSTQLTSAQVALTAADTALSNRIAVLETSLPAAITTINQSIAQVRTDYAASDSTLSARIDALSGYSDISALIDSKIAADKVQWQAADAVVNTRVTSVQSSLQSQINSDYNQFANHFYNHSNPHQVTAAQVDAWSSSKSQLNVNDIFIILNSLSSRITALGG